MATPDGEVAMQGVGHVLLYTLDVLQMSDTYAHHAGRTKICSEDMLRCNRFFCPVFARLVEMREPSIMSRHDGMLRGEVVPNPLKTAGYTRSGEEFTPSACECSVCAGVNAGDPEYRATSQFEKLLWDAVLTQVAGAQDRTVDPAVRAARGVGELSIEVDAAEADRLCRYLAQ